MNDKSCLLDATVHTLCLDYFRNPNVPDYVYDDEALEWHESLLASIGHDGSERGFHTQEIQDALRAHNILMLRHELFPALQLPPGPDDPARVRVVPIYPREEAANIFLPKINRNNGVLMVRSSRGVHHALSFEANSNTAYDVAKDEYIPLEKLDVVMFLEFIREAD